MAAGDMLLKRALFYGCQAHLKNQTETVVGSHAATRSALPGNSLALLGDGKRERGEERREGRGGGREGGRKSQGERMTQVTALSGKTIYSAGKKSSLQ